VQDVALKMKKEIGMEGIWSCSKARKGYSGTAILLPSTADRIASETVLGAAELQSGEHLEKLPLGLNRPILSEELGPGEAEGEGRIVTAQFGSELKLVNVYVPNAGDGLKRLDFRINGWESWIRNSYMKRDKNSTTGSGDGGSGESPPMVLCGDLNVAHLDKDFFCPENKDYEKLPGTTPQERETFGRLLSERGMVDTFRAFHPNASGVYSYWSQRARNRQWNRGLRLDYFVADKVLMEADSHSNDDNGRSEKDEGYRGSLFVLDSRVLDTSTIGVSDHAPVALLLGRQRRRQ